jgi:hypothetical protein
MAENKFVILKTYRNTRNLLDFLNIDPQGLQEKFCKAEQDWGPGIDGGFEVPHNLSHRRLILIFFLSFFGGVFSTIFLFI